MKYQDGFKKSIVRRLLHPDSPGITKISEETGVSTGSLYNWLTKYKESVELTDYRKTPEEWTLTEKCEALLESAALSPEEQGEWLRRNGLHSSHLTLWQKQLKAALADVSQPVSKEEQKAARKKIQELEREIRRKDKALAEMSALIVLKKKLEHIFLDEES
jgi:transposase-like protein